MNEHIFKELKDKFHHKTLSPKDIEDCLVEFFDRGFSDDQKAYTRELCGDVEMAMETVIKLRKFL